MHKVKSKHIKKVVLFIFQLKLSVIRLSVVIIVSCYDTKKIGKVSAGFNKYFAEHLN